MSPAVTIAARAANPGDRRFRIVSVRPGEDWRKLLRPSPPANDRPSGVALRTPAARDLPTAYVASIDRAVKIVGRYLPADRRFDLRQDLALKLIAYAGKSVANLEAWCVTCARNLLIDEQRDEAYRLRSEDVHASGAKHGYRKGPIWKPTWYPPHKDAREFAPLACRDARVMHVKTSSTPPDVETALVDWIDERAKSATEKRDGVKKHAGAVRIHPSLSLRAEK